MLTVLLAQTSNDGGGDGWLAALAFLAVAAAIALIQWRRQRRRRTGLWKQSPRS
jgi:cyanate permease